MKTPSALLWHEHQNSPGKEYLPIAGGFATDEQRSKSAVGKNGRDLRIGEQGVIVSAQFRMPENIESTFHFYPFGVRCAHDL